MDDIISQADMLKKLRLSYRGKGGHALTQRELAAMAGISQPETISKIERGKNRMTAEQVVAFARVFNVNPAIFTEGEGARDINGFSEEAEPFDPGPDSFESHITLKETQSWYRLKNSRLDEIGLQEGDAIVMDIGKGAMSGIAIGDVVIANLYSADGKHAETIARQWIPPHLLITNSRRRNLPPINVETDNVTMLGVVVWPRRNPKGAHIPYLRG